jgi:predicted glutamine amidotransferase
MLNCFQKDNLLKSLDIQNYTSANFVFVTPNKIIVGQNYNENPKYSTMKLFKNDNSVIISSEILPTFKQQSWKNLDNHTFIEINLKDF